MPDNDDSFIEAGIRFTFDPEGFLRGSAEAQDALESTLAEMINFRRETQKQEQQLKDAIPGIASALGASVDEVKDALKDLKKTEQDTAKETARVQKEEARSALAEKKRAAREEEQLARKQQREEMARLRERQQAIREIRDTALAAVGATSMIGGARQIVGMVGNVAANGANVLNMAEKTGFSSREILAVGEAGALTPGSSKQEALQSMNALAQARTEWRANGTSSLIDVLANRHGVNINHILNGSYETAMQNIVADLRRQHHSTQTTISFLEQSGLTSGGWSNEVLRGQDMHRRIQQGYSLTRNMADNLQQMEKVDEQMRHIKEIWGKLKNDIAIDMLPAMKSIGGLLEKADEVAKEHPDAVRHVTELGAVIIALGPVLGGIASMMGTVGLIRAALGKGGCGCVPSGVPDGPEGMPAGNNPQNPIKKGWSILGLLRWGGITALAGYAGYEAHKADSNDYFGDLMDRQSAGASWLDDWLGRHTNGWVGRTFDRQNMVSPEQAKANQQKAHDFFISQGWSEEQTAGLLARMQLESGFSPFIRGDHGAAFGLFQWHKDRRDNFFKVFGHRMEDGTLDEQLKFAQWELQHSHAGAGAHLHAARDSAAAGEIASREYIAPGLTEAAKAREALNTSRLAQQINAARAIRGGAVHTDNSQKTNIHVDNLTVKANNKEQLVSQLKPGNNHMLMAASVNTGVV
ncbi:phage tail tip lysozyme [Acetobacter sp. A11-2]|uniref:phage tail tip lysozyme n=1 Tax=Acetobacter sp. A11-2 TaxID=3157859 RepID=UPI0032EE77D2